MVGRAVARGRLSGAVAAAAPAAGVSLDQSLDKKEEVPAGADPFQSYSADEDLASDLMDLDRPFHNVHDEQR